MKKYFFIIFICFQSSIVLSQHRWSVGPSVLFKAAITNSRFSDQFIVMIPGLTMGKDISLRTTLIGGVNFFRSSQYDEFNIQNSLTYYSVNEKANILELIIAGKTLLSIMPSSFRPFIYYGLAENFRTSSKTEIVDSKGSQIYKEGFTYNGNYFYTGIGIDYYVTDRSYFTFYQFYKYSFWPFNFKPRNEEDYFFAFGIGLGYNLKF